MANSTVCQSKSKPIVEPRRANPKSYRQAIDRIDSIVQTEGKRNFNADLTSVGDM